MTTTMTKSELESQVAELTKALQTENANTQLFATVLGQFRYRIAEELDLDYKTRSKLLQEVDTVFMRAL